MTGEELASRADAAAARLVEASEGDRRERLGRLTTDMNHAIRVFGYESGAWRGCLLALVEEVVKVKVCVYRCRAGGWCLESAEDQGATYATDANAETRGEALVCALEAVP